ncbi:MAG: AAA family ATPase [Hyphomicrobiaceae bacterium]
MGVEGGQTDGIVTRRASEIPAVPVTWLWPQRIPRGKLALLGGHPGEGKTLISMYMASVVSRGGQWTDGTHAERGQVIILSHVQALRGKPGRVGREMPRVPEGRSRSPASAEARQQAAQNAPRCSHLDAELGAAA